LFTYSPVVLLHIYSRYNSTTFVASKDHIHHNQSLKDVFHSTVIGKLMCACVARILLGLSLCAPWLIYAVAQD